MLRLFIPLWPWARRYEILCFKIRPLPYHLKYSTTKVSLCMLCSNGWKVTHLLTKQWCLQFWISWHSMYVPFKFYSKHTGVKLIGVWTAHSIWEYLFRLHLSALRQMSTQPTAFQTELQRQIFLGYLDLSVAIIVHWSTSILTLSQKQRLPESSGIQGT